MEEYLIVVVFVTLGLIVAFGAVYGLKKFGESLPKSFPDMDEFEKLKDKVEELEKDKEKKE